MDHKIDYFIWYFQVDLVCHGDTPIMDDVDGADPYAVSLGYFKRERASL